jgi:hypothetical protein
MNADDMYEDPVFALLRDLPTHDVSRRRAARLHAWCRLWNESREIENPPSRWIPAILTAACVVYVVDVVIRAAKLYGF